MSYTEEYCARSRRVLAAVSAATRSSWSALAAAVRHAGIPERTLKRRFRSATGTTLIDHLQNLRIEHAKQLLEATALPVYEVGAASGYEDTSFFRRLFTRKTGVTPKDYRRMFKPVAVVALGEGASGGTAPRGREFAT